jgi:hypothetical protein
MGCLSCDFLFFFSFLFFFFFLFFFCCYFFLASRRVPEVSGAIRSLWNLGRSPGEGV